MLLSMTGYGKASTNVADKKITVEIKSLNSKQMDISTHVPLLLREKEIEIRNIVSSKLVRGKVDLCICVEEIGGGNTCHINVPVMQSYKEQIEEASKELGLPQPVDWHSILLRLPEVVKTGIENLDEQVAEATMNVVNEAIEHLIVFREQEGKSLQKVFTDCIHTIGTLLEEVEPFEKGRVEKIKQRMRTELEKLPVDYDKNRFEQELIFYIEKLDISEEKNRLRNHLNYFMETMRTEETPGKKLGFIAQEMGREINTLGSKSNQSEMQIIVVKMKDNLEQIKEQVLNAL